MKVDDIVLFESLTSLQSKLAELIKTYLELDKKTRVSTLNIERK